MVSIQRKSVFVHTTCSSQFDTPALTLARVGTKARLCIRVEEGVRPALVWILIELGPGGKSKRAARDKTRLIVLNAKVRSSHLVPFES